MVKPELVSVETGCVAALVADHILVTTVQGSGPPGRERIALPDGVSADDVIALGASPPAILTSGGDVHVWARSAGRRWIVASGAFEIPIEPSSPKREPRTWATPQDTDAGERPLYRVRAMVSFAAARGVDLEAGDVLLVPYERAAHLVTIKHAELIDHREYQAEAERRERALARSYGR